MRNLVGIDLGSRDDYTVIVVLEQRDRIEQISWRHRPKREFESYRLVHLSRSRGQSYTKIVDGIQALLSHDDLKNSRVVVDTTGLGRPIVDMMKERHLRLIKPVVITGGDRVTSDTVNGLTEHRVPKRDLVGALQILYQNDQLKMPEVLELREKLIVEMLNFRAKIDAASGHDRYEHEGAGDHDDLVIAVALAAWYAEDRRLNHRFAIGLA